MRELCWKSNECVNVLQNDSKIIGLAMTIKKKLTLLEGLKNRVSHPRLTDPMPSVEELAHCYEAAFRAPDHAWLRPWRFIECRGTERDQLGVLLAKGLERDVSGLSEQQIEKVKNGPLRAPLVIVCYAHVNDHPKVPVLEQQIAAGCAAHSLIMARYALGYGAVWRTGDAAYSQSVRESLNLDVNEQIIGFLYVGTPLAEDKEVPKLEKDDFVTSLAVQLAKK